MKEWIDQMVKESETKLEERAGEPSPFYYISKDVLYIKHHNHYNFYYIPYDLSNVINYSVSPTQEIHLVYKSQNVSTPFQVTDTGFQPELVRDLENYLEQKYRAQLLDQLLIANPIGPVAELYLRVNEVVKTLKENKLPLLLK